MTPPVHRRRARCAPDARAASASAMCTCARSSGVPRRDHRRARQRDPPSTARRPSAVGRLFEELVVLLQRGQHLDEAMLRRSIDMVRDNERPSTVLTDDIMRGAKGKPVRPKTAGQKRYIDAIRNNVITFGLGPAGTGKSWLAVAMAVQALQTKQVQRIILTRPAVEAGERLGLPARRPDGQDRSVPAAAVRRAVRHGRAGGCAEAARAAGRRGGAAGVHARPHAEQQLHHPRRGAERDARADEDVPHPHRLRLEGGRHRRHHPGRRARRPQRPARARAHAQGIEGLTFVHLGAGDVVRHRIVADIVAAYERTPASAERRERRAPSRG